jgi:hypothetical protein
MFGDIETSINPASKADRIAELEDALKQYGPQTSGLLELATLYLDAQRDNEAWEHARQAFDRSLKEKNFESAVAACDILAACDNPEAVKALAHGIWLGITFPIDPEVSTAILQHLVDESPPGSETQAVAAVAARFIADVRRKEGQAGENLLFLMDQRLAEVAARHRSIKSQEEFQIWMMGNEFDNPDSFLPKLSAAVDAMVTDDWWIDREGIRRELGWG